MSYRIYAEVGDKYYFCGAIKSRREADEQVGRLSAVWDEAKVFHSIVRYNETKDDELVAWKIKAARSIGQPEPYIVTFQTKVYSYSQGDARQLGYKEMVREAHPNHLTSGVKFSVELAEGTDEPEKCEPCSFDDSKPAPPKTYGFLVYTIRDGKRQPMFAGHSTCKDASQLVFQSLTGDKNVDGAVGIVPVSEELFALADDVVEHRFGHYAERVNKLYVEDNKTLGLLLQLKAGDQ